jgi:hypothetical protein
MSLQIDRCFWYLTKRLCNEIMLLYTFFFVSSIYCMSAEKAKAQHIFFFVQKLDDDMLLHHHNTCDNRIWIIEK